jgi:hypothetical protein
MPQSWGAENAAFLAEVPEVPVVWRTASRAREAPENVEVPHCPYRDLRQGSPVVAGRLGSFARCQTAAVLCRPSVPQRRGGCRNPFPIRFLIGLN